MQGPEESLGDAEVGIAGEVNGVEVNGRRHASELESVLDDWADRHMGLELIGVALCWDTYYKSFMSNKGMNGRPVAKARL